MRGKNRLLLGIILLLTLIIIFTFSKRGFYQHLRLVLEKEQLQKDVERLRREKTTLEMEIEKLQDSSYVEKIAREKYGMGRKNEKILDIVPDPHRSEKE